MKLRLLAIAIAALVGALIAVPVASAQAPPTKAIPAFKQTVPITGKAGNRPFTGTFKIQRFGTRGGKAVAVGVLKGKLGSRRVSKGNVALPAQLAKPPVAGAQASCPILNLVLGPLDLNLLGLRVQLNQV